MGGGGGGNGERCLKWGLVGVGGLLRDLPEDSLKWLWVMAEIVPRARGS